MTDSPFEPAVPGCGTEPSADVAQQLRDLQKALRESLAGLVAGVGEIREQLVAGASELRNGDEPRSLGLALQNLQGFYALLAQIGESFPDRPLPALDGLDAAVNRGVARLDEARLDEAEGTAAIAEGVESVLLPALESWPQVASELAAAIGSLSPELFDSLP